MSNKLKKNKKNKKFGQVNGQNVVLLPMITTTRRTQPTAAR